MYKQRCSPKMISVQNCKKWSGINNEGSTKRKRKKWRELGGWKIFFCKIWKSDRNLTEISKSACSGEPPIKHLIDSNEHFHFRKIEHQFPSKYFLNTFSGFFWIFLEFFMIFLELPKILQNTNIRQNISYLRTKYVLDFSRIF